MDINVCTPTLNRYDLLKELIASLQVGTLKPTRIWVIDNGLKLFPGDIMDFTDEYGIHHHYASFGRNLGCADSWNHFIRNTSDVRIIVNDDIAFAPDALEKLVAAYDPEQMVCPDSIIGANAFSCFMIPDGFVRTVGLFDENISPSYCYCEDGDMARRMLLLGREIKPAPNCVVTHGLSSTLNSFSPGQMREHHDRFRQAQINYILKWGNLPPHEIYDEPYDGAQLG